jgi:hypothetical protein
MDQLDNSLLNCLKRPSFQKSQKAASQTGSTQKSTTGRTIIRNQHRPNKEEFLIKSDYLKLFKCIPDFLANRRTALNVESKRNCMQSKSAGKSLF